MQSELVRKKFGIAVFPEHVLTMYKKTKNGRIAEITDMPERKLFMIYHAEAEKIPEFQDFIRCIKDHR